ncbi:DUF4174 domain-containing protein [uncultured Agrobacterium sp.]|uniref:DUF4174 domain-containing protein n=1 Tax=uncultured Agrobacterium sp. TaxID=157277 RepID=UPI0025D1BE26|nr:DUF4174 domain-containing protein [uncultured Agrobacterium sp.]
MDSLSELKWKNRVIIVFGSSAEPTLDRQIALLARQKDELEDHDLVVIRVSGDEAIPVYGNASGLNGTALRKDTNVSGEHFQIVLVGKDGGVKLSSDQIVESVAIFELIDAMPMRRAERG